MTLYDLNKSIIKQLPNIDKEQLETLMNETVKNYIQTINDCQYFMLLNKEKGDYTVFNFQDKINYTEKTINKFLIEFSECLLCRGQIKSIETTEDKVALEIWINEDCYYLFPYDEGVIEI